MAQIYKFFNSGVDDPRKYQASDFADYFGSLLSTGLLSTEELPGMVVSVETSTLNTTVSTGKAIMKGHLYENSTPLTLTHSIPEASLNRIDRVVLRLDSRNQSRFIKLFIIEGTPSATPVAPVLQRDNFIHEISLAQILVRANTVQLLPSDIVDERLKDDLCGIVTWLPKLPTSQFQDQWDDFMAGIEGSGFATADSLNAHKSDDTSHVKYADDTGSANAKVVALSPVPAAYKKGMALAFTNLVQNTGAVTINVNGLGAKSVLKSNGLAIASGSLKVNSVYTVRFNGTSFILQGEGGEYGTAIASEVLAGKTIGTETGLMSGSMINRGAHSISLTDINGQPIPEGYHNGLGRVTTPIRAGDAVIYSDINTGGSGTESTEERVVYTAKFQHAGAYRIIFDLGHTTGTADNIVYCKGRVNGNLVFTEQSDRNYKTEYSVDLGVQKDDIITLSFSRRWSDTNARWQNAYFKVGVTPVSPTITKMPN